MLPWDRSQCVHGLTERCSGSLGCVVDADAAAMWHATLARRWSDLVTYLRRELEPMGVGVQYLKVYEPQKRQVLHVHAMVRFSGAVSAKSVEAIVRRHAAHFEFGKQLDMQWIDLSDERQIARKAGYVAKYICKQYGSGAESVRMLSATTGEVWSKRLRSWTASREWGDTMRSCKQRRAAWWSPIGDDGVDPTDPPGAAGLDLYGLSSTSSAQGRSVPVPFAVQTAAIV